MSVHRVFATSPICRPTGWQRLGTAWLLGAVGWVAAMTPTAHAAPFVPADEQAVVETLKQRIGPKAAALKSARLEQRAERLALQRDPQNLNLALRSAREAIGRARQEGDPRELGAAQAALAPWWNQSSPPPMVRLLRAIIRQSQHDFDTARTDLDALLRNPTTPLPLLAQAELTRASVLQVQGQLDEARAGCQRLTDSRFVSLGDAVRVPAEVCLAELRSLQGQAMQADKQLQSLALTAEPPRSGWLALVRAELAQRRGDPKAGELFRAALREQDDVYTLAAYSDWLLLAQREREVLDLLAARGEADALLLRLAIAQQRLKLPQAAASIATLQARFDATRLRGDTTHRREEARFQLDLRGDARAALALAQANWQIQKEPADAMLLADAARAAGQAEVLHTLLNQLQAQHWRDVRLYPQPASASKATGSQHARGPLARGG